MRFDIPLLLAALVVPSVSAHYTFDNLLVNKQVVGESWQYVRQHERGYMPTFKEEAAVSDDFRCNLGAGSGANTEVYTVKPGDEVGLKKQFEGGMAHPGPVQLYLSRAPSSVKDYDGSGEWIKVFQGLICEPNPTVEDLRQGAWCMWEEDNISFTLPGTIPDGEYLLRAEHIALHGAHVGKAEFYYACAQIKVEGSSASAFPSGPTTLIPGVYKVDDAAINFSIWGTATTYPDIPGIDVAVSGQVRGSSDGSSGDVSISVGGEPDESDAPEQPAASVTSSEAAPTPTSTQDWSTTLITSVTPVVPTTASTIASSTLEPPGSPISTEPAPAPQPISHECPARRPRRGGRRAHKSHQH